MKKAFLFYGVLASFLFLITFQGQAQYVEKDKRKDTQTDSTQTSNNPQKQPSAPSSLAERITFGGNLALQFGNPTVIDVSPLVGYRFTESFNAGLGVTYFFYGYEDDQISIQANLYGGRLYQQYILSEQIFIYAEQEFMSTEFFDATDQQFKREWLFNPLVGAGLRQGLGGRSAFNLTVLYNLNHQPDKSIYPSPWIIRVGFML